MSDFWRFSRKFEIFQAGGPGDGSRAFVLLRNVAGGTPVPLARSSLGFTAKYHEVGWEKMKISRQTVEVSRNVVIFDDF